MTNVPNPQLARATRNDNILKPWVRKLQVALRRNGANCGVDGDFGPGTERRVKEIQQSYGLIQSGVVAANEWAVLDWAVGPSATYYNSDPNFAATSLTPSQTITTDSSNTDDEKLLAGIWNSYGGLITVIADDIGIEPAVALAIFSKESSGDTVRDGPTPGVGSVPAVSDRRDGEPIMRFENHKLFQYWAREEGSDNALVDTTRATWYDAHFEHGKRPPSTSTESYLGHKYQDPGGLDKINTYPVQSTTLTLVHPGKSDAHPLGFGAQSGNLIQNRNRTAINLAAKVAGIKRNTEVRLNSTPSSPVQTIETMPVASPAVAAPAIPTGGWEAYASNSSVEWNRHYIRELESLIPAVSQDVEVTGDPSTTIATRVSTEYAIWSGKTETHASVYSTLEKYYDYCNYSGWTPAGTAWSAVFISWIIGDSDFPKSSAHRIYSEKALKNRLKGKSNSWHLFSISREKIKVELGDVLVKPRGDGTKGRRRESHGDVVYQITGTTAKLAGGNVGQTMNKSTTVTLTADSHIASAGNYLIVLKKVVTPVDNYDEDNGADPREKFVPGANVYNSDGEWLGVVDSSTVSNITLVNEIPLPGPSNVLSEGDELFTDDFEQAYRCASFGCAQVMGFNHEKAGYESAEEMYEGLVVPATPVNTPLTHCDGNHTNLRNHIYLFFDFFRSNHRLIHAAKNSKWKRIGSLYNGRSAYGDEIEEYVNIVQNPTFHGGVF